MTHLGAAAVIDTLTPKRKRVVVQRTSKNYDFVEGSWDDSFV
jgi:hypothetical protein